MTDNSELELMRNQMQELKQSINQQNLVNEQLMRQIMAYKSAWIRHYKSFELYFLLPFIYLSFLFIKFHMDCSWLFYIATVTMCTISIVIDVCIGRLDNDDYTSMPLADLMVALEKRRKYRRYQIAIGMPVAALWLIWYIYECFGQIGFEGAWIGALIGGLIGGLIGTRINNNAQRTDAEAIKEIKRMIDRQE